MRPVVWFALYFAIGIAVTTRFIAPFRLTGAYLVAVALWPLTALLELDERRNHDA